MGGSGWRPGLGGWEVGEMWEMAFRERGGKVEIRRADVLRGMVLFFFRGLCAFRLSGPGRAFHASRVVEEDLHEDSKNGI